MSEYLTTMRVESYNPKKQFGFCTSRDGTKRAFFHVSDFLDTMIPPIPGELVEAVLVGPDSQPVKNGPSAKAKLIRRLNPPIESSGRIRSFDGNTGWGFIEGDEKLVYFLHQADIMSGEFPVIGTRVRFYVGSSKGPGEGGRPRACAVVLIHE